MKVFSKLMLVTTMAASSSTFALQAMTDDAMSATTGQDGITVKIVPKNSTGTNALIIDNVVYHDKDGLSVANGGTASGGTIVMGQGAGTTNKFKFTSDANGIEAVIDADGGTAAGGKPMLNIKLNMSTAVISTGDIYVAGSQRHGIAVGSVGQTAVGKRTFAGTPVKIMDTFDIKLSGMAMNIQLGNESATQGHLMKISGNMVGGFALTGVGVTDYDGLAVSGVAGTGINASGSAKIGQLTITDAGSADLAMNTGIDITQGGLAISNASTTKMDILMENIVLGGTPSIGDVALLGVDSVGTSLMVGGH